MEDSEWVVGGLQQLLLHVTGRLSNKERTGLTILIDTKTVCINQIFKNVLKEDSKWFQPNCDRMTNVWYDCHVVLGKVKYVILGFAGNQPIQLLRRQISLDINWKQKVTVHYIRQFYKLIILFISVVIAAYSAALKWPSISNQSTDAGLSFHPHTHTHTHTQFGCSHWI